MDIMEMMRVAAVVQAALETTDDLGVLMSAIGCGLDYWAADRGVSAEDLENALRGLVDAAVSAHSVMGLPKKGERYE